MDHRTVVSERRKEARKRPLNLVYVELSAANGGMLRDLSELGFAVRAMMPLHVGEVTAFSFLLDETTRVEGQCKVLWVEEDGRLAGMQFKEVAAGQQALIRAWLGERKVHVAPAEPPTPAVKGPLASTMDELREELRTVVARSEAPERDELPLPELHEEVPPDREEMAKERTDAAEGALEILRDLEVATASEKLEVVTAAPQPDAISASHLLQPFEALPVLSETELDREASNSEPWKSRELVWLAIRIMIVLALILAAAVYHRPIGHGIVWLGQKIAGEEGPEISPVPRSEIQPVEQEPANNSTPDVAIPPSSSATASAPVSDEANQDSKDSVTKAAKKPDEVPPVVESPSLAGSKGALPPAPVPLPAASKTTTFMPQVTPNGDGGQQEFLAAQDILKGADPEARIGEAVRLLWRAVEKGNSGAEVALAKLYRTGRGVAKNCDQTKILFSAAAKKGNLEAQSQLRQFLREGCE